MVVATNMQEAVWQNVNEHAKHMTADAEKHFALNPQKSKSWY